MDFINANSEVFKIVCILVGAIYGLWQYTIQAIFNRRKNLDELWRRFYENESFLALFNLMDKIENDRVENGIEMLRNYDSKEKLKFLAYLSEITIFYRRSWLSPRLIDEGKIILFFQWHFHYVYTNERTKFYFWSNLVKNDNQVELNEVINIEIFEGYWSHQMKIAQKCSKSIGRKR